MMLSKIIIIELTKIMLLLSIVFDCVKVNKELKNGIKTHIQSITYTKCLILFTFILLEMIDKIITH